MTSMTADPGGDRPGGGLAGGSDREAIERCAAIEGRAREMTLLRAGELFAEWQRERVHHVDCGGDEPVCERCASRAAPDPTAWEREIDTAAAWRVINRHDPAAVAAANTTYELFARLTRAENAHFRWWADRRATDPSGADPTPRRRGSEAAGDALLAAWSAGEVYEPDGSCYDADGNLRDRDLDDGSDARPYRDAFVYLRNPFGSAACYDPGIGVWLPPDELTEYDAGEAADPWRPPTAEPWTGSSRAPTPSLGGGC